MLKHAIICFISCFVDLKTKQMINNNIKCGDKREIIPEKLYLINTKNKGIAYNKLETKPEKVKFITAIITAVFGTFFLKISGDYSVSGGIKVGSALVLGGALGNLIDRFKHGEVTDFIHIKAIKKSPVFNLADVFIAAGAIIIAVSEFINK